MKPIIHDLHWKGENDWSCEIDDEDVTASYAALIRSASKSNLLRLTVDEDLVDALADVFSRDATLRDDDGNPCGWKAWSASLTSDLSESLGIDDPFVDVDPHDDPEGLAGLASNWLAAYDASGGSADDMLKRSEEVTSETHHLVVTNSLGDPASRPLLAAALSCLMEIEGSEDALVDAVALIGRTDAMKAMTLAARISALFPSVEAANPEDDSKE